jgi:hypothetical protein
MFGSKAGHQGILIGMDCIEKVSAATTRFQRLHVCVHILGIFQGVWKVGWFSQNLFGLFKLFFWQVDFPPWNPPGCVPASHSWRCIETVLMLYYSNPAINALLVLEYNNCWSKEGNAPPQPTMHSGTNSSQPETCFGWIVYRQAWNRSKIDTSNEKNHTVLTSIIISLARFRLNSWILWQKVHFWIILMCMDDSK